MADNTQTMADDDSREWREEAPEDTFYGDKGAAEKRFRKMAEKAIASLPTQKLNLASYTLSMYIDMAEDRTHDDRYTNQIRYELDAEQEIIRRRRGFEVVKGRRERLPSKQVPKS